MSRLLALVMRVLLLALFATALLASPASADTFGRMFSDLPGYAGPPDFELDVLTAANGPIFDPNLDADDNPARKLSFNTYFGQFVDHDTTEDHNPSSTLSGPVDPETLTNFQTPQLDLDSVYGGPPGVVDQTLLEDDGLHFKIGAGGRDLPRDPDTGFAIVAEGRNDENQIIAQIHVAFLRHHNALIDQGLSFADARRLLTYRYQWVVVHDFLAHLLDDVQYAAVFKPNGRIIAPHARKLDGRMVVEFSVGAYRFGHSMVRRAYGLNCPGPGELLVRPQVFNPANPDADLHGGRPIPPERFICWANFVDFDGFPQPAQPQLNVSRKIDGRLSSGLFGLPIPGAANDGSSILARRNLQRARSYGVPSGQDVATALELPVLSNEQIAAAVPRVARITQPEYGGELPLWLYVLLESEIVENGGSVGPTGSRIIAEVIGDQLKRDANSYVTAEWQPPGGVYREQDLLRDAGVAP